MQFASQAVHAGNRVDEATGAIMSPIVMANSYRLPPDPAAVDWSNPDIPLYTRTTGANQQGLQDKLAILEGAEDCCAFASGVAALHAVFFTFLHAGDHVIVSNQTYEATWRLFAELFPPRYQIDATFVDINDLEQVAAARTSRTKLIVTETIANPTTRVADIPALAQLAHEIGALLVVDSTFTPPPMYRPLADGADLVVQSLTKYYNGHGDAMGGAVLGPRALVSPVELDAMVDVGGTISPFNAWLISRGVTTLPLRLRRSCDSALAVAEFLAADPRVAYVDYPGLPGHAEHRLAQQLFGGYGYGATLAFAVDGDHDAQNRLVDNLRLVTSAVSLGHAESLIVHVGTDGPRVAFYPERYQELGHLRLAVGLEEPADLLADLSQALDATFPNV